MHGVRGHPVCGSNGLQCIDWIKHMQDMFVADEVSSVAVPELQLGS